MDERRAQELLGALGPIDELPSIPAVVLEAVEILQSDSGDSDDLSAVISQDPVLTSQILRVANSVAYARTGGRVDSLQEGIMRLGFSEVENLCLTAGAMAAFDKATSVDLDDFWNHSATTAIASGELARLASSVDSESRAQPGVGSPYYLAGLLHDVGVLACRGSNLASYGEVLEKNTIAREPLYQTESSVLGFHHGEIGAALASVWGLPDIVVAAAEWHHEPHLAPEDFRTAVEIVHLADWMTHHLGIGDAGDGVIERFDDEAWIDIGLDIAQFPNLINSLAEASQEARLLIQRQS